MNKFILTLILTLSLITPVWSAQQINDGQVKAGAFASPAMTSQEVLVHNESATAHSNQFTDYYNKTQTESTVAVMMLKSPALNRRLQERRASTKICFKST